MTIQTKHFIELSDIVALRLACKECGATLSVLVSDERLKSDNRATGFMNKCPTCRLPWVLLNGSSYEQLITRFVGALGRLKDTMHGDHPPPLGFSLTLEIKPDAVPEQRTK